MANKNTLEFIESPSGEWFWRFKAGNGKQVSWSGETYTTKENAVNGALVGSPAIDLDWEGNTFFQYSAEEETVVSGKLVLTKREAPSLAELRGESDQEKLADSARSTLKNPIAHEMIDSDARRDSSGHITIETSGGRVQLHLKDPESDNCAVLNCKVKMIEE